ncbi:MAG: hypothetical protein ABF335_10415 [Alphaproteobacteria bacterium]
MIKSVSWSKQPSLTALAAGTLIATGYLFSGSATAADAADGPPKGAIFDDTKIQQLDDRDAARQRSRSRRAPSHQPRTDTAPAAVPAADGHAPAPAAASHDTPEPINHHVEPVHDDRARPAEFDRSQFGGDPVYDDLAYDPDEQLEIYGGKKAVYRVAPLIEWPEPMYQEGPLGEGWEIIGRKNPVRPQLLVYGDFKSVVAYNDNGNAELAQAVAQLNIDIDLKLTATERIHAFMQPLQDNRSITRTEFGGGDKSLKEDELVFDPKLETLFLEGDLGAIISGLTDEYTTYDLPFAIGVFPTFYQNGIWADDDIGGLAFTIPSLNSPTFDISNMDLIFFYAPERVTTQAVFDNKGQAVEDDVSVYAFTTTIEALSGYIEAGIGYIEDDVDNGNGVDFSYTNVGVSFTKRYRDLLSYSFRFIGNFGQDPGNGIAKTADGELFILETSFVTHLPSTLVPYVNVWYGNGKPRSLIRDNGGILKNVGINFETDALTGFPKLDDTAEDTFGGAAGVMYLFALDQQLIVEVASVQTHGDRAGRAAPGDQYAIGARYQKPLSPAWIIRFDGMFGERENQENISGMRMELRRKF